MARQLTAEEEKTLRAFQRQVDRLRNSTIVQRGKVVFKYKTSVSFPSGEIETQFNGYEKELFQSQLPILRQFFLQDTVNFNRIHNLLNQCCEQHDLLEWVRFSRRNWMATLTKLPINEHRYFHNARDDVEQAAKKLFYGYGGLFHVDIDEPDEEKAVSEIYEATLQTAFPYFWNCLNNMDSVIHIWLDDPNKPVPPLPTLGATAG